MTRSHVVQLNDFPPYLKARPLYRCCLPAYAVQLAARDSIENIEYRNGSQGTQKAQVFDPLAFDTPRPCQRIETFLGDCYFLGRLWSLLLEFGVVPMARFFIGQYSTYSNHSILLHRLVFKAYSKERPTHIMIISDPQVRHPSIFYEETSWLGSLRQLIFDLNLKKNWNVAAHFKPDVVIFLGDMLASGKHVRSENE